MVSAYPALFYPGEVYPGQVDTAPPPPPTSSGDTTWGSWKLTHDGTWIRRETRVLVWGQTAPGPDVIDGASGSDILDGASGTDLLDGIFPPPADLLIYDGNGSSELLDGGGSTTSITDGNG